MERTLLQRAEWAERRLMEIEHERLLEQEERRRQADHDRQALAKAEQRRKADEEREQVRRGAWWDYLMDTSQPEHFKNTSSTISSTSQKSRRKFQSPGRLPAEL